MSTQSSLASGQLFKAQHTFVHGRTGEYEGAFNGGGTLPVASGVSAKLAVSTEAE